MSIPELHKDDVLRRARAAQNLREVGNIAAELLEQHFGTAPLIMTPIRSGGIMRGGRPSAKANLEKLRKTIEEFENSNIHVFDQLMFKPIIDLYRIKWRESDKSHAIGYYEPILYDFYGPILATGSITVLFLLPGWHKSRSCKFVKNEVESQGGRIIKLEK